MDAQTLGKAIELDRKIDNFNQALNCFEWTPDEETGPLSTNPSIIIEFDDFDGGREKIPLPMNLSNAFVEFMKAEIIKGRNAALAEFEAL